jgi:XTP/dITP diphosphohydrolase
MRKKIVLATRNIGKIAEFERLLVELAADIHVLGLADFPDMPDVEETGATLTENALLKSRQIAQFTDLPSLADDSGLFIDALGGDPGVYSARWAGTHGDDRANTEKVLAQLRELEERGPVDRSASFRCVIALSFPDGHPQSGRDIIEEGEMRGSIIDHPRGAGGFGYDPIFTPVGYSLTSAEISSELKDQLSHRGRAMRRIAPVLISLL